MAVNVTLVPGQIVVALAAIVTDGVTAAVTVMVIALEAAAACVTHTSEDVITTVITSLFVSVAF